MGIPAVYILASSVMAAPGAVAIAKLMAESCHCCSYSKEEKHLMHSFHVPQIETGKCKECIANRRKELFKEKV